MQDEHFEALARQFVVKSRGIKTVAFVVVLARAERVELAFTHVAVRDDEAIRRDEGARSSADPNDCSAEMLQPCGIRREMIFAGNGVARRIAKEPVTLVGLERIPGEAETKQREDSAIHAARR